jgi:hypothetical protein
MKTECNRPIEERTEQSTRSGDGQKSSTLTMGQRVRVISRWQTRGSADGYEGGGIQRNTLDGKHRGGGSIYDCRWVEKSVLEGLRLLRESFSIFSSFLSLDASKHYLDRLGVGLVPRT